MSPKARWILGVLSVGFVLFWGYLLQSRTVGTNSDAASQALQAWEMLHGNVLLRGWVLSDVSFYTTELPEYVLVEAVRGLGPGVIHVCAALTYTLLVVLAALLGRGRSTGREGVVRAVLAGGIMVAPGLFPGTQVLLLAPNHTGTGVPILFLLVLIDRLPPRWYVPVIAFVLLTLTQIADPIAIFAAAAPVAIVCLMRARSWRVPGNWRALWNWRGPRNWRVPRNWRALRDGEWHWFDGSMAAAALVSVPAAALALDVIRGVGGFVVHPVAGGTGFAAASAIPEQARTFFEDTLGLFGAYFFADQSGLSTVIDVLHLAGVVLAVCAVGVGVRRFFSADRVSQILLAGVAIIGCAGLLGTHMSGVSGSHEIVVLLPFGAVLAGRLLGARLLAARLVPVASLVLAGYVLALGYGVTRPAVPDQDADLTAWLQAHGLTSGLSGYWQANSVRLDSGGKIAVVSLLPGSADEYLWETKVQWLDPAASDANFLVSVSGPPGEEDSLQVQAAYQLFGRPAQLYHFRRYTIAVFKQNLLQTMAVGQPPGVG